MIEENNIGRSVDQIISKQVTATAAAELAPCPGGTTSNSPEHVVQFYESDAFLMDSLSGFISTGLVEGETCVVVATREHHQGVEERLRLSGKDVEAVKSSGDFVSLDASETLSRIIVNGVLDPALFTEVIGGVVAQAAERGKRVRIFGEMVAVLWAAGNENGALQLEECWNELHKTQSFTLFCAYPISGFDENAVGGGLSDVCGMHMRSIPAESYSSLTNIEDRLRNIIQLQQKAKSLEAEIIERKEIAEQLRVALEHEKAARAMAERADRLKDEFLATVSHELRTPLNAIIGWAYMIRSKGLDEAMHLRAIETIERNAKSQAQLIEDILDMSRIITGKLRLDREPVDVVTVINSAIDSLQLAADSKDIQLEVTLSSSSRYVMGDTIRLQQIVWNLLSNAIKFTPSGGSVSVRLDSVGPDAQITVSDSGEGIDGEFLPFIFDRFRQADGASTRRHGGLGLGLAIVRHLVELHGGAIQVDSMGKGAGTTFTIKIPLADIIERVNSSGVSGQLRPFKERNTRELPQLSSLEGVRVLVVDNDEDTVNVLAALLTDFGVTVHEATSVAEALEGLESFKPNVLVSDLAMPDEDGYALIRKIRTLPGAWKNIPAVALTAHVRIDDRARALSAGFNMFVPKPVVPGELISAIVTLADLRTNQLQLPMLATE